MKPCINCGEDCEILPVQLGDLFTLSYVRVCGAECMFLVAYEYMREHCIHKQFRGHLYDKQNEEDKIARDKYVEEVTEESLRMMREHFQQNPDILSRPCPDLIHSMFANSPEMPDSCGKTMRFTRPAIEDRIKWATEHVERMKVDLREALKDLEKLENEREAKMQ